MENKEFKFCQSCGMPLTDEVRGTNADGSKSGDYCIFCYKDGSFTGPDFVNAPPEFISPRIASQRAA